MRVRLCKRELESARPRRAASSLFNGEAMAATVSAEQLRGGASCGQLLGQRITIQRMQLGSWTVNRSPASL